MMYMYKGKTRLAYTNDMLASMQHKNTTPPPVDVMYKLWYYSILNQQHDTNFNERKIGNEPTNKTITTICGRRPQPRHRSPRPPSTLITVPLIDLNANTHQHTNRNTQANANNNKKFSTLVKPKHNVDNRRKETANGSIPNEKKSATNNISLSNRTDKEKSRHDNPTIPPKSYGENKIKIMVVNCRSLVSEEKKLRLEQLIITHEPDVIIASETHLDDTIDSNWIFPDQYLTPPPYRKDRKLYEGGVLIAIKDHLVSVELETDANCEIVWTRISLKEGSICIGSFYRQPSSSVDKIEELNRSLTNLSKRHDSSNQHIILAGDMNLPDINWDDMTIKQNPQYGKSINEKMIDTINDHNLTQIVKEKTRQNNILDLIFTNKPDLLKYPSVFPGMSDHKIAICDINVKITKRQNIPQTILLYNKGDNDAIKEDLKTQFVDFEKKFNDQDINQNWNGFKKILTESISKNIPKKTIIAKSQQPWVTREIKRLIKKKQRRYNRAKRSNKTRDWQEYRDIRSLIHKKLRDEHNKFVRGMLEVNENDQHHQKTISKKFWRYIRSKRNETTGISVLQRPDGTETTDAEEKANLLNNQYKSVFTKEDSDIPILGESNIPSVSKIDISLNGVIKQLQNLDARKSTGPDEISPKILKEAAIEIAPYLAKIFQQSLDSGYVPNDWKHANITALFKKGKRVLPSNYRPVSLTSVACKVLEHIIFHNIMHHLEKYDVLADHQHGFRKHHSCETQLITTVEAITRAYDQKQQMDLVVLDFSKAFDTVAHKRLLSKLEHVGIKNIDHDEECNVKSCEGKCQQRILQWFESWLCNRTQQVMVDGKASEICEVTSGVPQGTVLGPLCFLIYINDISENISIESKLRLFADDSLLYRAINSEEDTIALQKDINALTEWTKKWQMHFHPSKCHVMTVSNKKHPVLTNYKMKEESLSRVDNITYLGVNIQSNLRWDKHIQHTISKANRSLGFIKRNLHQCPQSVKAQAYTSLVRPVLEYAHTVWDPHLKTHIESLEKVQKRAARFVTGCKSTEKGAMTRTLKQLEWTTLEKRREQARLVLMHKIHNKQETSLKMPTYFRAQQTRYTTRSLNINKFTQPRARTDHYQNSFYPRTIRNWNNLPNILIDEQSHEKFKKVLNS